MARIKDTPLGGLEFLSILLCLQSCLATAGALKKASLPRPLLSTLQTEFWILFVVTNRNNANAVGENSVKKVIGKTLQIRAA